MELIDWFVAAFQKRAFLSIQTESIRYIVGTLGVFFFIWIIFEKPLSKRKIRKPTPRGKQIRRELLYSASTILTFMMMGIFVFEGAASGIFKFYFNISDYGWGYLIFSTILLIIAHDTYFYWTHRLIHHPRLFKHFHKTHHRSHNPTPFTAYSFDIGEAMINFMIVPIYAFFVPVHGTATLIFMWFMIIRNAIGHSGYEILPRGWARHPILGQLTGVVHHDMHHERATGNYGLYFTFWDRIMGTEHKDYLERVDTATGVSTSSSPTPAPRPLPAAE